MYKWFRVLKGPCVGLSNSKAHVFKISMKVERVGGDFLHGSNEHIKTFLNKLSDALHPNSKEYQIIKIMAPNC